MGFATSYLKTRTITECLVSSEPQPDTGVIIIVPSFDEPSITELLNSLAECDRPKCSVEVLIGVNAPPTADKGQISNNIATLKEIESWKGATKEYPFRLFAFDIGGKNLTDWGAGLARKVLMDEAVRRFNSIENPNGVVVSLDADCLVSRNYLSEIFNSFSSDNSLNGASIHFEHILPSGTDNQALRDAITDYELHLRYYYQALIFSGYPNVFHTIGSALAVRSSAYVKVGGMNRRQAGEDFYFIQKMIPLGGYGKLNRPIVYPSGRTSNRVPFGTGPAIISILESPSAKWLTYHPDCFKDLKLFIELIPSLLTISQDDLRVALKKLPQGISQFLTENNLENHLNEIRGNTSGLDSFIKRFLAWFNMFKVVKYLNYQHISGSYAKIEVSVAARDMLSEITSDTIIGDRSSLLKAYRKLEE
jgi:hypothetical protein